MSRYELHCNAAGYVVPPVVTISDDPFDAAEDLHRLVDRLARRIKGSSGASSNARLTTSARDGSILHYQAYMGRSTREGWIMNGRDVHFILYRLPEVTP